MCKALPFICLIYDAFVGCDHRLASIWIMVWDIGLKTTLLPLIVYLNLVCNDFNLTWCMAMYLWTLCNMWHACWIMYDLGCMVAMNRDPSWYSTDYQVYMGSSMIVRPLAGYHCTCALINWMVLLHNQPHLVAPHPPLWCGVLMSLLEPSRVVFTVDKHD